MCPRPRHPLAPPRTDCGLSRGWRRSAGAMHSARCRLFLQKVLCPNPVLSISVGITVLRAQPGRGGTRGRSSACKDRGCSSQQSQTPSKVSLVPPRSLPGHCPGALTSVYLTGCCEGHVADSPASPDRAGTSYVAFCLLRKRRETETEAKI